MPLKGTCLIILGGCCTLVSGLWANELPWEVSAFSPAALPNFAKAGSFLEQPHWTGGKPSLKKFLARRDKDIILHGHVQEPSLNWEWGFRNGIKYKDAHDEWHLAATYTHFHSKSFASVQSEEGFFPVWQEIGSSQAIEQGQSPYSSWRLDVDIADVEMGKAFVLQKFLSLHPHLGVRTTWMYQKFAFDYEDLLKEPIFGSNCLGVGFRGGVDTSWRLGRGASFFGDGAISWLSGYHNIYRQGSLGEEFGKRPSVAIAMVECSFGLQYKKSFRNSLGAWTAKLGYELNYFFNRNKWVDWFNPIEPGVAQERLSLQGLSMGFRLDF